ncbi:hypothetical protein D922_02851 [Enterococcus faecalis 06-MB-DW-09]|nr:hypothetical protein D922_02851 [Enterococcus faecalis 06-MB-DW-09]
MEQYEVDQIFKSAVTQVHEKFYSKEQIEKRMSLYADENNQIGVGKRADFYHSESMLYINEMIKAILKEVLVSE